MEGSYSGFSLFFSLSFFERLSLFLYVSSSMFVGLNVRLLECCCTSTETIVLLGTGAQDGHLDFHTAYVLLCS